MDFATVIADAMQILSLASTAVQLEQDVQPYLASAVSLLEGKTTLTDAQRAANVAAEKEMIAQLDAAASSST